MFILHFQPAYLSGVCETWRHIYHFSRRRPITYYAPLANSLLCWQCNISGLTAFLNHIWEVVFKFKWHQSSVGCPKLGLPTLLFGQFVKRLCNGHTRPRCIDCNLWAVNQSEYCGLLHARRWVKALPVGHGVRSKTWRGTHSQPWHVPTTGAQTPWQQWQHRRGQWGWRGPLSALP